DPGRGGVPGPEGVPAGPAGGDEAPGAGAVQGAGEEVLRGAGEVTRSPFAFPFAFAFAFASPVALAGKPEHAYRLMNEWRIEEAEAEVAQLVKAHPHDPDVAFVDGNLKFLHGEYDAAVERFGEAGEKRAGELGEEIRSMRELAQATAGATH